MRMRYVVPAIVACVSALSCSSQKTTSAAPSEHGRRILYYHDPMHPSYRSSQPGIAPDCNMQLTPVYAHQ